MPKRRVNMRFVGIGLVILMAVAVIAVVLVRIVLRPSPAKLMAEAQTQIKAGDWDEAAKSIGKAIKYSKKSDPNLWIALADASLHLTGKDPQAGNQAVYAWNQAIQIDPRNVEALRARTLYFREVMDTSGMKSSDFDYIRDSATKLLEASPDDKLGLFVLADATIKQWLGGVETDPSKIEEACERLEKVMKLDPSDADAPYVLVSVKIRRAGEAVRVGDKKEAARLADEADKLMADAVKANPDSAMMHMRYSLALMNYIAPLKGRLADRAVAAPATRSIAAPLAQDRAARRTAVEPYIRKGVDEANKAAALAKPGDKRYGDIRIWYCGLLQTPDVDPDLPQEKIIAARRAAQQEAEKAYQESIQKAPAEQTVRLAFADMLGHMPGRIDDAIKLLSEEPPPNPNWIGARGMMVGNTKILTARLLAQLKLDRVDMERDATKREALIQDADGSYQALMARLAEYAPGRAPDSMPDILQLKARLQLARNQLVDATQTLNRALSLYSQGDPQRYETMFQLSKVYLLTQQTGEAKKLLKDVVTFAPNFTPARQLFAGLLIQEGNIKGTPPSMTDGAVTQIEELEKQLGPTNPIVVQLKLATLDPDTDKVKFDALMKSIPETTLQERVEKAQVASRYNRHDEAVRLLNLVRAERPTDEGLIVALTQEHLKKNDRPAAIAVVDEALKAQPDNPRLKLMKTRFTNPEQARDDLVKAQLEGIEKIADPLQRELSYVQFYTQRRDDEKAMQHALAAEKIAPDDQNALRAVYLSYLDRKDWDKASGYLERLAKMNADQADGLVLRVQFALAQGHRDEALEQAKKLTAIRPEFNQSWVMLGSVLQELGRYDEAINAYQQALERKTENNAALRGLVQSYLALNRPGKPSNEKVDGGMSQKATDAKLYLEMAQRIFPTDPWFKEQAQGWELRYGDVQKALGPREQYAKDHPDDPGALGDLALAYINAANTTNVEGGSTNANTVQQEQNKKKYLTKARDTLMQGAAKFPEVPAFNLNLLLVNAQLKDYDAAEKAILALVSSPDMKGTAKAAIALANFYVQIGKPQQAEKPLRDYLAAHPDSVVVETALASFLSQHKRGEEALKVLEANSTDPAVGRQRVDTLVSLGRIDEAAKALDADIAKKSTPLLQVQRAQLDLASGKFDEARKRLNQVLTSTPDDVYGLFTRARLNLSDPRGDVNIAIDDLNRMVSLQPESLEARMMLADAYRRRGLPDEAIRNLEAAARMDPSNKPVRLQLIELYSAATPPRWLDVERLLKDAKQTVSLANDVDLQLGEAKMWLLRKDPGKALDLIKGLRQQQPDSTAVLQAYYAALIEAKDYRTLLSDSDVTLKTKPDLWWLYQYRGMARRRGQQDRAAALNELKAGLAIASKNNDLGATNSLIHVIATDVGPEEAKKVLAPLAEKDVAWQIVQVSIMQDAGDMAGALALVEKVLATPNLPAELQERALKLAGILYLAQETSNIPKAVGVYRQLLQLIPNDTMAMNNLASLLTEEGTSTYAPAEAVVYAQKVYDLSVRQGVQSELPLVMDTYAWALICSGRIDEGISQLRSAMEKKSFVDGHYHLGRAYMLKQPPDLLEAQRALDTAWQLIQDAEREGRYPDPIMKGKVEKARNELRQQQQKQR